MMKPRTLLSLGVLGLLALASIAVPVLAKPGDGSSPHPGPGPGPGDRMNATERREQAQERRDSMRDAHDAWQDCKREYRDNQTLNVSMQKYCMADKDFFLNATHARREAHALIGAIIGLERRLGRLEERKILLEQELNDSSNLTGNQTAALQQRIDKIQAHEEKVVAELQKLRDHLKVLDDKWESVREHVAERRHKGLDDGLESESDSDSASESDSDSESSSA
jgi:hypothetical protein